MVVSDRTSIHFVKYSMKTKRNLLLLGPRFYEPTISSPHLQMAKQKVYDTAEK